MCGSEPAQPDEWHEREDVQALVEPDGLYVALARLVPVHHDVGQEDGREHQQVGVHSEGLGRHDERRGVGQAVVEQDLVGSRLALGSGLLRIVRHLHGRHPGALEGKIS